MTNKQLEQAIDMHEAGVTRMLIAIYFKTNTNKLRKGFKQYEQTNSKIHEPAGTG